MIRRRPLLEQHRLNEREQKSFQLLELLRQRGPLTRTELSQGTGFNIVTVSNYINHFIETGLVSERGFDISTGGRKPTLVELNAKAGFTIGLDLGPKDTSKTHTVAVMTDLRGHIVHRVVKPRTWDSVDVALQEVDKIIHEVVKTSPVEVRKIQGIGIGLAGIMDERAGTVRDSVRRTNYQAVRDQLENALHVPVMMGNDATLAGYGEYRLGLDRPVENFIYLYSDVGASLIFNGEIYWGSSGGAGELGLLTPNDDDYLQWVQTPAFTTTTGCDLGLVSRAKKLMAEGYTTTLPEFVHGKIEQINLAMVLRAAQEGDSLMRELAEHAATQLGIRIAYLVNLLNPDIVVIGGGIEKSGSMLLEPVWRAIKRYAYEEPANLVDVLPAQLGENAVALGAACWLIREVFIQA